MLDPSTNQRPPAPDAESIKTWLVQKIAGALSIDPDEISVDRAFSDFGLDSTEALRLSNELGRWLGVEVAPTVAWYYPTINELSDHLARE